MAPPGPARPGGSVPVTVDVLDSTARAGGAGAGVGPGAPRFAAAAVGYRALILRRRRRGGLERGQRPTVRGPGAAVRGPADAAWANGADG